MSADLRAVAMVIAVPFESFILTRQLLTIYLGSTILDDLKSIII